VHERDYWSLLLRLTMDWNHTAECVATTTECICGLPRVLELARIFEEAAGGETSRYIMRMKKLEVRQKLAAAILEGKEDDMLRIAAALDGNDVPKVTEVEDKWRSAVHGWSFEIAEALRSKHGAGRLRAKFHDVLQEMQQLLE
jgi:hypothetical protein